MKTLGYVLGEFPVMSETFVGCEMRAMIKLGYQVQPLTFVSQKQTGQPIDQALVKNTHIIAGVKRQQAAWQWLQHPLRIWRTMRFIQQQQGLPKSSLMLACGQLAHYVQRHQIDHLHAHFALHTTATAIACALLTGCKVSFVGHGYDVYATPKDLALKLKKADFSVAVCADMLRDFKQQTPAVHLINCGIELTRYPFKGQTHHNGRLLFIGRLVEKKGLLDLLTALAALPKTDRPHLDLIGEGPQRAELERCSQQLRLTEHVHFLGSQPSDWIIEHAAHYLALCAPFCEAKNGDRDTGPVVVKEAMALGLPVITTRFMGCQEMLTQNTGYLVKPNAPHQLAKAIVSVKQLNSSQRKTLLSQARYRLEQYFSSDLSAQKLARAIEGVSF